jgi:hypothetical protein
MASYAADTTVTVAKSREEIENTLRRYGADGFMFAEDRGTVTVMFRLQGRIIRFKLEMPARDDSRFTTYMRGSMRYAYADSAALKHWEQACRQKWRALALVIKAKLEAVSAGITTIEDEFLAHTVLPDNTTFGEWAKPRLKEAYELGHMPTTLMLEGPK